MIFRQSAMAAILFFRNETTILHRQVFIAINIPCKFGEDNLINELNVKVYVKSNIRMHRWTDVYTEGIL